MIRKARFALRLAGQDLKGNLMIHLVSAAIISAAFLTVGVFILVAANLNALARFWEKKVQVCVYLADAVGEPERRELSGRLLALSGVERLEFVSKEQALVDFKAMLGEDQSLLEGLEDNPLPASFIVHLQDDARAVEQVREFAGLVSGWPGVDEVDYGGAWLESFQTAVRVVQGSVFMLGALIVVAVVFIISNTIRLTMFSRKDEIGIMKLVGASNLLIRVPFVIEGMLQGLIASGLGILGLWVLYFGAIRSVSWPGVFSGFSPVFISGLALISMLAGGALLGALGSMGKVRDFLRV